MRSVLEYINESIEDGKYLDLPTKMYKPMFGPGTNPKPKQERRMPGPRGSKSTYRYSDEEYASMLKRWEESNAKQKAIKKNAEEQWKKHIELNRKIDEENFEILVNKMYDLIENKGRRENFIKTSVNQIIERIKNTAPDMLKERSFKEMQLIRAVNSLRKSIQLDNESTIRGSGFSLDSYEENIYDALYHWGSVYGIELPRWSSEREAKNSLFSVTVSTLMDEYMQSGKAPAKMSDEKYSEKYKKFADQVAKDKTKVAKFRAAWAKTEQYKKLLKIADMIEDDVETIEKTVDRAYTRFDELNGKNKAYAKAKAEVVDIAKDEIEKVFKNTSHAVSCWGKSLIDILVMIKLSGQDDPEIEVIDSKTSGWMSGMRHSCKFKVTDSEGNEYVTGRYEDRGFDSFERSNGDGFGAWD